MTSSTMRGARRGLVLAAGGIILAAGTARAQDSGQDPQRAQLPPGAVVQPLGSGPGADLRRNLTTLSEDPRNLDALIGAGRAAIAMGDGEAALGFFARADEVSASDARVKAGMGSALVLMERAGQALPLFAQAISLGAPEAEIAGDRGLAYDMIGDPRRAQQDYAVALRRRADPEVERRMALSLAISGQRQAALRVLDAQLRRHDRAGWRAEAFVLALTGDPAGAEDTASRMMPQASAREMAPFFARLASLSPAQKAAAVHFGRFPSDGRAAPVAANVDTRANPDALALAREESRQRPRPAEPLDGAPRRRPGAEEGPVATLIRTRRGDEAPPVEARRPVEVAQSETRRFEPPGPKPDDAEAGSAPPPGAQPREAPAFAPGANLTLDGAEQPRPSPQQPAFQLAQPPPPIARPQPELSRPADFGQVAAMVQALPQEEGAARPNARSAPPPASAANARQPRGAEPPSRSRSERAASANPARHWVQLAHAGTQSPLPRQFADARGEASTLLESRTPFVASTGRINRLLVGPFASEAAAQAFVDQLARRHVEAIAWTSPAGQEIERLRIANEARSPSRQSEPEQRTAARASRARSEPEPRSGARGGRDRPDSDRHAASARSAEHGATDRRATSRGPRDSATAGRKPARSARGRSGEEQGPGARGRRSH